MVGLGLGGVCGGVGWLEAVAVLQCTPPPPCPNTGLSKYGDPVFPDVWAFLGTVVFAIPVQWRRRSAALCRRQEGAAGAPAGVLSAFAEPRRWCAGAVLDAAGSAVCASAVPSSWRIGGCAGGAGVV